MNCWGKQSFMNNDKIKIFIIDDDEILRAGLKFIIDAEDNMEVVGHAGDARKALAAINESPPDIVITDISMPGLDGIETTLEIKGRWPSIKVLVLTMHDDERLLFNVIKSGGSGYVLKTSTASEILIDAINMVNDGETFVTPHIENLIMCDHYENIKNNEVVNDQYDTLTKREKEILGLIAEGYTNKQISEKFVLSINTVETHRRKLVSKLRIHNKTELINYARRKKFIEQ